MAERETDTSWYCHLCSIQPTFATKSSLNRHIRTIHEMPTLFACTECSSQFTRKEKLNGHFERIHKNNAPVFACAECTSRYSRKDSLKAHIARSHKTIDQPVFECGECSSRYRTKLKLRAHIARSHGTITEDKLVLECAHCMKTFGSKYNLRRHIATHRDIFGPNHQFECYHCSSMFAELCNLRRHIKNVHLQHKRKIKRSRFTCLKCWITFPNSAVLNKHYVDVHEVILNYEEMEFDSSEKFEKWFESHQSRHILQFVKWYKKTNAAHSMQRFMCHRSGIIRSSVSVDTRKRHLKNSGYKPLGGICPAEIRLYIQENGKCYIKYQKTHVGHDSGDKSELKYVNLTRGEKESIATEIQSGIPLTQIVSRRRSSSDRNTNCRLSVVTRQDIRNIAASQKLGFEDRVYVASGCDPINVELIIEDHKDDILFYKRQTEEDTRFKVLVKEDFAIVIMTSNQRSYLLSHAHKVVSLDGTHGTNPYKFILHTLMVRDTDCEGLTGAFLITNRNDGCVIDIFLKSVRDRVGILEPQTLMTDMQLTHWNSWTKIMNVPRHHLFCTWHVNDAWRRNLSKIPNKDRRKEISDELMKLRSEINILKFEDGWNLLLERDDDDVVEFLDYLRQHYDRNKQKWAYCYRTEAGVNTHMNIESFHKSFKRNVAGGQKIQTLTQCLAFIFKHLTLLESNVLEKKLQRQDYP